jgi:NCAIR mutase (PurE)-related protein
MTQPDILKSLLESVSQGEVSPEDALDKLKYLAYEPVGGFANIDHHRALRTGFPEVIWGPGKTPEQIARIMETMRDRDTSFQGNRASRFQGNRASVIMATRIEPGVYAAIQELLPEVVYYPSARICALKNNPEDDRHPGTIGLLSAGTADLPVAEEAAVTAELCGFRVQRLWDVGVAGIHRLLSNLQVLADADVLIVVAGMEGALPSVVAGLADCPVIAVPTSVGYGASFQGLSALLTMLNSCAAGIGVVNIDNGFGAAILAGQILRTAARIKA